MRLRHPNTLFLKHLGNGQSIQRYTRRFICGVMFIRHINIGISILQINYFNSPHTAFQEAGKTLLYTFIVVLRAKSFQGHFFTEQKHLFFYKVQLPFNKIGDITSNDQLLLIELVPYLFPHLPGIPQAQYRACNQENDSRCSHKHNDISSYSGTFSFIHQDILTLPPQKTM